MKMKMKMKEMETLRSDVVWRNAGIRGRPSGEFIKDDAKAVDIGLHVVWSLAQDLRGGPKHRSCQRRHRLLVLDREPKICENRLSFSVDLSQTSTGLIVRED